MVRIEVMGMVVKVKKVTVVVMMTVVVMTMIVTVMASRGGRPHLSWGWGQVW